MFPLSQAADYISLNCACSYPTASFALVAASFSRPIETLRIMGRIVDGVNYLPISLLFVVSRFLVAVACEVLARRIVHTSPTDRIPTILSSRYKFRQSDGDIEFSSAIELGIDTHA